MELETELDLKILIVYPKFKKFLETNTAILNAIGLPIYADYKAFPSLGVPILTALTPDIHELYFVDGNIDDIPYEDNFDLVAISCFTPQAKHAFEVASKFRVRGTQTIMGGIFPSNNPEACLEYCESVFIGEVELGWAEVLEDAGRGSLKKIYKVGCGFDLSKFPIPDRRLFKGKKGYDWRPLLLQCFRGCSYGCASCAIPSTNGSRIRMRPIESVMEEIERDGDLDGLYLGDDQFLLPDPALEKYSLDFFSELSKLHYKKKILMSSSPLLNKNDRLMRLLRDSGVNTLYFVMGWDPVSISALSLNQPREAEESIKYLKDWGFNLFASIGVGLDLDTPEIFPRIVDFLGRNDLRHAEFWIVTPFPGTPSWRKYQKTKRIVTEDFDFYNGAHAVFTPKKMSALQLDEGFIYLWKEHFTRAKLDPAEVLEFYTLTSEYKDKHGI